MNISKVLLFVAGVIGMVTAAPAQAGFYDGKDVTVIINAGAGGGLTRTGRLFTTHMKKHLGKDANMVALRKRNKCGSHSLCCKRREILGVDEGTSPIRYK